MRVDLMSQIKQHLLLLHDPSFLSQKENISNKRSLGGGSPTSRMPITQALPKFKAKREVEFVWRERILVGLFSIVVPIKARSTGYRVASETLRSSQGGNKSTETKHEIRKEKFKNWNENIVTDHAETPALISRSEGSIWSSFVCVINNKQ